MITKFFARFTKEFGSGPVPKLTIGLAAVCIFIMAISFIAGVTSEVAEAAPEPNKKGYVDTFEAQGVPTVYKYCDGNTTIYVTPATSATGGGGPGITAIKNPSPCTK